MSSDARGVLRTAGLGLAGFALLMMLVTWGGMLWMDVPLLVLGLGMAGYALWDARRAAHPPDEAS